MANEVLEKTMSFYEKTRRQEELERSLGGDEVAVTLAENMIFDKLDHFVDELNEIADLSRDDAVLGMSDLASPRGRYNVITDS